MKKVILYIHGKGSKADEANHYKPLFHDYEVIGLDYCGQTPWDTKKEFIKTYNQLSYQYENVSIIANSIGAYFAMNALSKKNIKHAFFISPIVDMEKIINNMMNYAGIAEDELSQKKEILTSWGETLSWEYLCYVRDNPIAWHIPTDILYSENDNLISIDTISQFAFHHKSTLTIMKDGEHWFHTAEQMEFLDAWLQQCLKQEI